MIWVQVWSGILSGKGEVLNELRKTLVDRCCLQEVRCRGQCTKMLRMERRRYKLG